MKKIVKAFYLFVKLVILVFVVIVMPFILLIYLTGYRVPVGEFGIWAISIMSFIWLFWPLRVLVSLNKISLLIYFKQLFFDTKEIIFFIGHLLIGNIHLLWHLIKGLIKQISKH